MIKNKRECIESVCERVKLIGHGFVTLMTSLKTLCVFYYCKFFFLKEQVLSRICDNVHISSGIHANACVLVNIYFVKELLISQI